MTGLNINLQKIQTFSTGNDISLVLLFGSLSTGKSHARSDIDIALVPRDFHKSLDKLELLNQLSDIFQSDDVDLVCVNLDTDPTLLLEIFSKGKVLYESIPGLYDQHYLRAWKLYIDTEKIRKTREKFIEQYLKRIKHVA